jgi:hypothetical protein
MLVESSPENGTAIEVVVPRPASFWGWPIFHWVAS